MCRVLEIRSCCRGGSRGPIVEEGIAIPEGVFLPLPQVVGFWEVELCVVGGGIGGELHHASPDGEVAACWSGDQGEGPYQLWHPHSVNVCRLLVLVEVPHLGVHQVIVDLLV